MRVAICGAGVIGACTAYFLARRGVDVTVIDRAGVASSASGKAGGFLALDWCAGSPLDALARRSFALHAQFSGEIAADWGYRRMTAYSGFVAPPRDRRRHRPSGRGWLSDGVIIAGAIGTAETTGIVQPRAFTAAMMRAAQQHGAVLRDGEVTGLARGKTESTIAGVTVGTETIAADAIVIAMGPWSRLVAGWLSLPPVFGRRSPSLVYDTGTDVPAEALFLEYQEENGEALTVEVFPRADGSTHVTAFSDNAPLPVDPAAVTPQRDEIERLRRIAERISPAFDPARIVARQACFRPVTEDGMPLIGKAPHADNVYVATGHNVWGILNAPATGEAMAELIAEGAARAIDLTPFDPVRLRALDPARLRAT